MKSNNRIRLERQYGLEIVVKCCREWKTHYGDGKFGKCGICHERPVMIAGKKWEDE